MNKGTKILPAAAVALTVIAAAARAFQILVSVDYTEMGFFDPDAGFLATNGLYVFFAIAAVMIIVSVIIDKRTGNAAYTREAATVTPAQTAVIGVSFLIGACLRFYELVFNYGGLDLDFISEAVIFALYAVIGFMLLARRGMNRTAGYMQIMICVAYTLKAAALFMRDTIIVRVSDELLLLLSYVCSVFFFLALGRFISDNEAKLTRRKLMVFGAASSVLAACTGIAGCAAYIADPAYMEDNMAYHPLSEIGTVMIALAVIFCVYGKAKRNEELSDIAAE